MHECQYIYDTEIALKTKQLQMRVSEDFLRDLDELRKRQDDLPSRSEMIRRLVEEALKRAKTLDRS